MKYNVIILCIFLNSFLSCQEKVEKNNGNQFTNEIENIQNLGTSDTVLISLNKLISIKLNKINNKLIEDSLFNFIKTNYEIYKNDLLELITDTTSLQIQNSCKKTRLKKGDVAFIILDRIKSFPIAQVLDIQFDVFDANCYYPEYFFDYIEDNRKVFREKVSKYYNNNYPLTK